ARGGEHARDLRALFRGGSGEPCAQPLAARVGAYLPSRLGIDEPEHAGVRELLFARVADLDRDHFVPPCELEQRVTPIHWPAKVAHDDDDCTLTGDRPRATQSI